MLGKYDWTADANFQTSGGLWQDGLHPNAAGASIIGRTYCAPAMLAAINGT
jgi:hypothetical protein